jgi:hypothetical protein
MYIYICVYIYTYTYIHIHTYVCVYSYVHLYMDLYAHIEVERESTHRYIHTHIYTRSGGALHSKYRVPHSQLAGIRMPVRRSGRRFVCVYVYMYMYAWVYVGQVSKTLMMSTNGLIATILTLERLFSR